MIVSVITLFKNKYPENTLLQGVMFCPPQPLSQRRPGCWECLRKPTLFWQHSDYSILVAKLFILVSRTGTEAKNAVVAFMGSLFQNDLWPHSTFLPLGVCSELLASAHSFSRQSHSEQSRTLILGWSEASVRPKVGGEREGPCPFFLQGYQEKLPGKRLHWVNCLTEQVAFIPVL